MNIDDNLTNISSSVENTQTTMEPVQQLSESETASEITGEENIGEHDIVIDEDFQINLDVAKVKAIDLSSDDKSETKTEQTELGTEQTGNITF